MPFCIVTRETNDASHHTMDETVALPAEHGGDRARDELRAPTNHQPTPDLCHPIIPHEPTAG